MEEGRHQQEHSRMEVKLTTGQLSTLAVAINQLSAIEKTTLFGRFFKNVVKCDSHFHCPETHI